MRGRRFVKTKQVKPDEYYSNGAFELARFGKTVVQRNALSSEDFRNFQDQLALSYSEVCLKIDSLIESLSSEVTQYSPLGLMMRAYCDWSVASGNKVSEADYEDDEAFDLTFLEYLQSLIVSLPPSPVYQEDISDSDWDAFKAKALELFKTVNIAYQICRTAHEKKNNPSFDIDYDQFRFQAQTEWVLLRGHRYMYHERINLEELLTPHSEIFEQLFHISVSEFIDAAIAIQTSLSEGLSIAFREFDDFRMKTLDKIEPKILARTDVTREQLPDVMDEVCRENGWEEWRNDLLGKCFGSDLFNLEKITKLPYLLMDRLSYVPGSETEFFSEGEFKGWPLRIWPTFKRPFIKLEGQYYCFNLHSFFDKIYRVLQKAILQSEPSYSEEWNRRQKALSESVPFKYFEKLLPGATIYRNVFYKYLPSETPHEADGIIIFDDTIIVVEVKAGAFTYTSPATDFEAYLESIRGLVVKPADQGKRFINFLGSSAEVEIYNSVSCDNKIAILKNSQFRNRFICTVTLDHFTLLASQIQHIDKLNLNFGKIPIWAVSLNDLRVYSDVFDNPLIFLHYLEHRMLAFTTEKMQTFDELDHLGLYLTYNAYTTLLLDYDDNSNVIFHGYVKNIDEYFHEKYLGTNRSTCLRQSMPNRFEEIIDVLVRSDKPQKARLASILLNTDEEWRKSYADKIEWTLQTQHEEGKLRPISSHGQVEMTTFIWQDRVISKESAKAIDHSQTVMVAMTDNHRWHLELTYSDDDLKEVDFAELDKNDLNDNDLTRLNIDAEILKAKRIQNALSISHKIGRNDPCPCGSGKKYKKCCNITLHN